MDRCEEVARWLPAIWQGDVELEVGLGAAQREAPHRESGALGQRQQRIGLFQSRDGLIVDDETTGDFVYQPLRRHPRQRVATGPACRFECLELDLRGPVKHAADDERVAPAAAAAERPHPGRIARLEEDKHCGAVEWGLAVANYHLHHARPQPTYRGALTERRQAALHPAHQLPSDADAPTPAGGHTG